MVSPSSQNATKVNRVIVRVTCLSPNRPRLRGPSRTLDFRATKRKLNGFWRISIHGHPGSSFSPPLRESWK